MSVSRSRFYVDTPDGIGDLPSHRHSMYAVGGTPPQDLSSASSSATLPSTAGSVDRLNEKQSQKGSPRFFTLRPKGSFSLRPFFSSSSIPSLSSPSSKKRRRGQQDSACQTDERPLAAEVGVQTLPPAPTVDAPAQTSSWDDGPRWPRYEPRLLRYSAGERTSYPTYSPKKKPVDPKQPTQSPLSQAPPSYLLYRPVSPPKAAASPSPPKDEEKPSGSSPPPDRPPSALKVERTDSPKVSKSVHFVLSDQEKEPQEPKKEEEKKIPPLDLKNLDKDFEALLRDLDIITDDPPLEETPPTPVKPPLFDSPPKPTLLSANLRSAFDSLNHHEVLPAILENADEDPQIDDEVDSNPPNTCESNSANELGNAPPTRLGELADGDDSVKSTSSVVFTTAKLDSDAAGPENVYESGIAESTLKTVLLPTLPSFFETPSHGAVEDRVGAAPSVADISDTMLSRSSSRSSMSSRAELADLTKKFDSCENLDQLENEIMRSLCTPSEELFDDVVTGLPNDRNSDPSQMRRTILDRLLSGESVGEIVPNANSFVPAESKAKPVVKTKYIATITKFDNDIPLDSSGQYKPNSSSERSSAPLVASSNDSLPSSVLFFPTTNNAPSKSNSVFLISDTNKPRAGVPDPVLQDLKPNTPSGGSPSVACDFSNCVRPSQMQNTAFLQQISARPATPTRSTPEPTQVQSPPKAANGQCDYASCLKPSQVQNSVFTAELSELTANKSCDPPLNTNPLTPRANTPIRAVVERIIANEDSEGVSEDQSDQEVKHKSEVTITLQTPYKPMSDANLPDTPQSSPENPPSEMREESSVPPPPPPPPPTNQNTFTSKIATSSLESMIKNQHSNLTKPQETARAGKPVTAPKSEMMKELEKRLESPRRHSCDGPYKNKFDGSSVLRSDIDSNRNPVQGPQNNSNNTYVNHSPVSAAPFKCNGSNGFTIDHRERSSSLPNGKHENGFVRSDVPYSSKTIITDAPPPPGAVLLDKKITVEGDNVHTDKYYVIPVREFTNEKTTTTTFVPAPPKYEGIGPTEDGVPIGLRNSVKKENMHNWYKTMFKSLHKADSENDTQEYVIGYSSEPESSRTDKVMRKKSATLDNRSGSNTYKNNRSLQGYPASAKSSIEVYRVKPRLIEDYEPGHSSVTDDEISYGSTRYLPPLNAPKPSYEFKNGYEQENNFIRNLEKPDSILPEEQKIWYKDIQRGGEVPQFGLRKPEPEKPKEPVIGPLPPPPLNYNGPTTVQASRPLTLPANYNNYSDNGLCQQSNGPYEVHMRQAIHTELQQRISPSPSQLSSPTRSILKSPTRSPDLKIPARALFDFIAESPKEIAFRKGDMVLILRQLDKNWYEGEFKGNIGIFPISYVEIVPPEHVSAPPKSVVEGLGKAMFDFTAQTSVELSLRKGDSVSILRRVDSNWYEARFNNKKGIVPVSYLQVLQEPQEQKTFSPKPCLKSPTLSPGSVTSSYNTNFKSPSPSILSVPSPVDSNRNKYQPRSKKGSNLIEPVMYKAIYSYSPQNTDELELLEGDIVCVVEMCDDGWYVGTSVRTGVFGIFPGNYVERI